MLDTRLDPRQTITACLGQWRAALVGSDDAGLRDHLREVESVSRMLHAVMLEAVAELDSRNIAATTGFGTPKRLLAGMLQLSATEAGTRVTHATQLTPPTIAATATPAAPTTKPRRCQGFTDKLSPGTTGGLVLTLEAALGG